MLQISPASGFAVRITATNTSDPVRNIRVVASAFEGNYSSQVFQPAFLAQVAGGGLGRVHPNHRVCAHFCKCLLEDHDRPAASSTHKQRSLSCPSRTHQGTAGTSCLLACLLAGWAVYLPVQRPSTMMLHAGCCVLRAACCKGRAFMHTLA